MASYSRPRQAFDFSLLCERFFTSLLFILASSNFFYHQIVNIKINSIPSELENDNQQTEKFNHQLSMGKQSFTIT